METAKDFILYAIQTFPGWAREYLLPPLAMAVGGVLVVCIVGWALNYKETR